MLAFLPSPAQPLKFGGCESSVPPSARRPSHGTPGVSRRRTEIRPAAAAAEDETG